MEYTLTEGKPPVSKVTLDPSPGEAEPFDIEARTSDILELFTLQARRQDPYMTVKMDAFGKEPGTKWNPLHTWIALPDGTCDPHILQVGQKEVSTYHQISEIYHGDYKLQGALRAWLTLGQKESVFKVSEITGAPFLERDAFLWRVLSEALHEAMFQCFTWKWIHKWERPVPAVKRAIADQGKYPTLEKALAGDYEAAQADNVLTAGYSEGHPNHPSFPAGHATCIGAEVTVLRAFFNQDKPLPLNPDRTIGEELAANARAVCAARMIAGIHYRRDMTAGLGLGEAVARKVLAEYGMADNVGDVWWAEDKAVPSFELGRWRPKK